MKNGACPSTHMLDGKDVHAINFEARNVVSSGEVCAALRPSPVCCAHSCRLHIQSSHKLCLARQHIYPQRLLQHKPCLHMGLKGITENIGTAHMI